MEKPAGLGGREVGGAGTPGAPPGRLPGSALTGAAVLLAVLWLSVILTQTNSRIAGERHWWLSDDAMISMRYARNLAEGAGLVWNPGERVEGYTNPLWTLGMAAVHLLPLPASRTSLVLLLLNVALGVLALPYLLRLVRELGGGRIASGAALVGCVLSADALEWATAGSETPLLTLLLLVSATGVLRDARENRPRSSTWVAAGLLSLVRSDAPVLAALLGGVALALTRDRRGLLRRGPVLAAFPVGWEIFRLLYYGDPLPNTAYLKVFGWEGRLEAGWRYVRSFAWAYLAPLVLIAGGCLAGKGSSGGGAGRRNRPLLAATALLLVWGAYVGYAGGDAFPRFRFFVPVLPLLLATGFASLEGLVRAGEERPGHGTPARPGRAAPARSTAPVVAAAALALLTLPLVTPGTFTRAEAARRTSVGNIGIGLLLARNTPDTARVADYWAGSVFYFSRRPGIDLLGKCDRRIARMRAVSGSGPGHNKFDFDRSLGELHPDYVVAAFRLPSDPAALPAWEARMRRNLDGDWAWGTRLYFHPLFRERCLPHPVRADTWRTIFACRGGNEGPVSLEWGSLEPAAGTGRR